MIKPETQIAILLVLSSFAFTIILNKTINLIFGIYAHFRHKKIYPALINSTDIACDLHKWEVVYLALSGIDPGRYRVCINCGHVAGTKHYINKPALIVYEAALKAKKEREALYIEIMKKRQIKLDQAMNKLVQSFYEGRGVEVFQQFFRKAVIEIDSINDEVAKDLDESKR